MPTTARLVAAILLGILGYAAAELAKAYIQEEVPVGLFSPVSAGLGIILGWTFTGKRLDQRTGKAVGIGLASAALLVFWVTLAFSLYEMIRRSMRLAYDGPVDALTGMVEIGIDYLKAVAQPDVIVALVVGGLIVGGVTEWASRRYR